MERSPRSEVIDSMRKALRESAVESDATFLQRFFKTGPGEYGEGDRFLGVRVPATRKIVRQFKHATLSDALVLLQSEWHEERLLALLLMVAMAARANESERRALFDAYLANTRHINNWDLVDTSAAVIVGAYLSDKPDAAAVLMKLAVSQSLWERRIAIISTFHFIRRREFDLTMLLAERLLHDPADLIHKAVGWMLREAGARDVHVLESFLTAHAAVMPRTMLRYAIEKFPASDRQRYLAARALHLELRP